MAALLLTWLGMGIGFSCGVWSALTFYHRAMTAHYRRLTDVMVLHRRPLTLEDLEMSLAVVEDEMDNTRVRDVLRIAVRRPDA